MRLVLLIALAVVAAPAARAQFYDLDGTYHCVTAPDGACADRFGDRPPPAPPAATEGEKNEAAAAALDAAIARVKKRLPTAADMRLLAARADAKDGRAVEVLAWCKLNGIGSAADPIAAYWLYRQAAALGIANARQNQIAIYERRLTSAQRQQVLLRENAR